jgi:hypothetical protein
MLVANNAQWAVIPIPGQETEVPLVRHVLRLAKLNLPRLIPVPMGPIKLRLPATPVSGSFCVVCTLMLFVKGTIFVQKTRKLKQVFYYFPLLSSTFLYFSLQVMDSKLFPWGRATLPMHAWSVPRTNTECKATATLANPVLRVRIRMQALVRVEAVARRVQPVA